MRSLFSDPRVFNIGQAGSDVCVLLYQFCLLEYHLFEIVDIIFVVLISVVIIRTFLVDFELDINGRNLLIFFDTYLVEDWRSQTLLSSWTQRRIVGQHAFKKVK